MQAGVYTVTAQGGAWLREGPGTDYMQLALVPQGAQVTADGAEQAAFARVKYGPVEGWIASPFLAGAQPAADAQQVQASTNLEITGQDVALRQVPIISQPAYGPGSNVLVLTNKGEVVENLRATEGGFQRVGYKGQAGWMSLLYLRPTNARATMPGAGPGPLAGPAPNVEVIKGQEPTPEQAAWVQTEVGPMSGGAVAGFLLLAALGIYFLAK